MPSSRDDRWPAFRIRELVRVRDGAGRREGAEGVVETLAPDRDGRGWVINVRFGPPHRSGTVWNEDDFWEEELEHTGLLENEDHVPAPLDPEERAASFLELWVALFVPITEEPLEPLIDRAETACRQLLSTARIAGYGRVYDQHQYPDHWWIWLEIRPTEPSRDAFELLVASYGHWQAQYDNGWSTDFNWYRVAAGPGEQGFLLPEADRVFLYLSTYSDPTYRPVPQGRNRGVTKFEEQLFGLPPPAGYERPDEGE